jgi:hypothetical protein
MKQFVIFAILILISASGKAEVFKCKTRAGVVYSEIPCAENSDVLKNQSSAQSAGEVRAAKACVAKDNSHVQAFERKEAAELRAKEAAKPRVVTMIVVEKPSANPTIKYSSTHQSSHAPQAPKAQRPDEGPK